MPTLDETDEEQVSWSLSFVFMRLGKTLGALQVKMCRRRPVASKFAVTIEKAFVSDGRRIRARPTLDDSQKGRVVREG